jgi:hypothetical protein
MRKAIDMALIVQSIYKIRQLESHGSQLSGAKNRMVKVVGSNFIAKGIQKSC